MAAQFRPSVARPILSLRLQQPNLLTEQPAPAGLPQDPFVWAEGGEKMTPAGIAIARELANSQLSAGANTSPVAHWAQGLDRVVQALMGGFEARRADKAEEANAAYSQQVAEAMSPSAGQPDLATVTRAASDPYLSQQVRDTAKFWLDRLVPKPSTAQPYRTKDNAGNVWEQNPQTGEFARIFTDIAPKQMVANGQLITSTNPYADGSSLQITNVPQPGEVVDDPRLVNQGGAGSAAPQTFRP